MMTMIDVPSTLRSVVQTYGRVVLQEPKRVEGLLRDLCGSQLREVNLLLMALKENIPSDLAVSENGSYPRELIRTRLKMRLEATYSITSDAAQWAVDAWDYALGFWTEAVSSTASQIKSSTAAKLDATPQSVRPQDRTAASAALLALWPNPDESATAKTVTAPQVQQLLNRGADVNVKDNNGDTALILAAFNGHPDCVQVLLLGGADANVKDKDGDTALMWAVHMSHSDCVQALLLGGADVNVKDNDGNTAMMSAVNMEYYDCAKLLKAASDRLDHP